VAWISLNSFYGHPAYRATAEVSLYIVPFHQGQGIGTKLLKTIIHNCSDFDITTLLGFVFAHNQPSIHLCKKVGFKQWGHLPQVAELDEQKRNLLILGPLLGQYGFNDPGDFSSCGEQYFSSIKLG
jgi:L-amino acid N-acyltransferase YncA